MLEFDDTRESLGRGTGADDETTRRDFESDGEEDQLDGGGGDRRRLRPDDAPDEATLRGVRLRRVVRPATRQAQRASHPAADGRAGFGAVPGEVLRFQRAAFPREAAEGSRPRAKLQLGEAGAARSRPGGAPPKARDAPAPPTAAAAAGHAAAHRWQQTPMASGRPLLRPDCDSGRCDQRDLLRAAGGRGIDGHGDGRSAGGDRNEGGVLRAVQRPGEPLLLHADGRRQGGQEPADAGGSSDARVGRADDRGVLAGGAGTVGAELRYLAKPAAAGVTAGRYYEPGGGQPVSAGEIYRRVQRPVFDRGPGARNGVPALQPARPGPRLLGPDGAGGRQGQHGGDWQPLVADRQIALALQPGQANGDDPSAPERGGVNSFWPACGRPLRRRGANGNSQRPGKAPWKRREYGSRRKPKAGFHRLPHSLGNLAKGARFPLFHRADNGLLRRKHAEPKTKLKCGRWESGNPKAGFPLFHRPGSLRRKEENLSSERHALNTLQCKPDKSLANKTGQLAKPTTRFLRYGVVSISIVPVQLAREMSA